MITTRKIQFLSAAITLAGGLALMMATTTATAQSCVPKILCNPICPGGFTQPQLLAICNSAQPGCTATQATCNAGVLCVGQTHYISCTY
jgi:hypothetical protein